LRYLEPVTTQLIPALLLLFSLGIPAASHQNTPTQQPPSKITVRFLNGKNGHPIKDDTPNIWFDDNVSPDLIPHTDKNGEVIVPIPAGRLKIRALPNLYADCRITSGSSDPAMKMAYSLETILNQGIEGDNLCGKFHAAASPGVLILYVRKRTFHEKMWL
jgi:hypothetical protein